MEKEFEALAERVAAENLPAVMAAVTDRGENVNIRIVSTAKTPEMLIMLLYTLIKSVASENHLEPVAFLKELEGIFIMEETENDEDSGIGSHGGTAHRLAGTGGVSANYGECSGA